MRSASRRPTPRGIPASTTQRATRAPTSIERVRRTPEPPGSIDDRIAQAVVQSIEALLGPYLARLLEPEPIVYTVSQVAAMLQVSTDTVGRLVKRGVLPRVPHLDGKVLIPRVAVDRLVGTLGDDRPAA